MVERVKSVALAYLLRSLIMYVITIYSALILNKTTNFYDITHQLIRLFPRVVTIIPQSHYLYSLKVATLKPDNPLSK